MNKPKEQAQADFVDMIKKSWTYQKMTEPEKERAIDTLQGVHSLKGSYNARWDFLNDIYKAFLLGVGYDGFQWRSENGTF